MTQLHKCFFASKDLNKKVTIVHSSKWGAHSETYVFAITDFQLLGIWDCCQISFSWMCSWDSICIMNASLPCPKENFFADLWFAYTTNTKVVSLTRGTRKNNTFVILLLCRPLHRISDINYTLVLDERVRKHPFEINVFEVSDLKFSKLHPWDCAFLMIDSPWLPFWRFFPDNLTDLSFHNQFMMFNLNLNYVTV